MTACMDIKLGGEIVALEVALSNLCNLLFEIFFLTETPFIVSVITLNIFTWGARGYLVNGKESSSVSSNFFIDISDTDVHGLEVP